jgi:hypothetical protein
MLVVHQNRRKENSVVNSSEHGVGAFLYVIAPAISDLNEVKRCLESK